jgi:predicted molibdopterin-dependent oxidoreductase YjgC
LLATTADGGQQTADVMAKAPSTLEIRGPLSAVRRHWDYTGPAQIADEIATVTPSYRGIVHRRLGEVGLVWPCPSEDHPGTPILHHTTFTRGLGKFHAVGAKLPAWNRL